MSICWCGDDHEPHCPTCDKCGAPITTGAMAMICPLAEQCEFWPEEGIPEPFRSMFKRSTESDGAKHGT